MKFLLNLLLLLSITASTVFAEEADQMIKSKIAEIKETAGNMISYVEQGNPRAAMKELEWLKSLIAPIDIKIIENTLFKDKVGEFSAVKSATYESAMSITTIRRDYHGSDSKIKMQLISMGTPGGNNPFAGLAALQQQYGQQKDQVRLGRRIMANVTEESRSTKLTAIIGGYNLELSGTNKDQLIGFAKALPIQDFEKYVGKD